jgi:diacylglycerol kinase family enzyme
VEFRPTREAGHGEELAREAIRDGFRVLAAAGGDGTVHEVANGILASEVAGTALTIIPLGSANDYAHSVQTDFGKAAAEQHAVDVGRVSTPGKRPRYFVCCLGLGLNGAVTLESRRIRGLRGVALYGLATIRALWRHYACPQMELAWDDEPPWRTPTLMASVLVGRREGGFVLAPAARLDDGWLDYVHAGLLSRWQVLALLPRLAIAGPPTNDPQIRLGRCRRLRLTAATPLTVHIDGEFFCTPEDDVRNIEVEIQPLALAVRVQDTACGLALRSGR